MQKFLRIEFLSQPTKLAPTFLWHSAIGFHLVQFLFFLGIYIPSLNPWISRMSAWLDKETTVTVDESWRVFNLDCKVSNLLNHVHCKFGRTFSSLLDASLLDHASTLVRGILCIHRLSNLRDTSHDRSHSAILATFPRLYLETRCTNVTHTICHGYHPVSCRLLDIGLQLATSHMFRIDFPDARTS